MSIEEKVRVVACQVEGNSLRATVRMTGVDRPTIQKVLVERGAPFSGNQDIVFRNPKHNRIQSDEVCSFIGRKQKKVRRPKHIRSAWGNVCTWTALDGEIKWVPFWCVGRRESRAADHFIHDLKARLANRVQLTTDGHAAYLDAGVSDHVWSVEEIVALLD